MKNLDYGALEQEVIQALKNSKSIVLATCSGNRVTARQVCFASKDFTIYFITSKEYDKCKQIEKNNHVALCLDNIQMEGTAAIKGHPGLEENISEMAICLNKCRQEMEPFIKYKNVVLVEVAVHRAELWKNNGREYLDIAKGEAYRIG